MDEQSFNINNSCSGIPILHLISIICPELIELIIKKGADPNLVDKKNRTAAYSITKEIIKLGKIKDSKTSELKKALEALLKNKTDPNIYSNNGNTLWTLGVKNYSILDILIKYCNPNDYNKENGLSAIQQIITSYNIKNSIHSLKKLLENKADPNLHDSRAGFTA